MEVATQAAAELSAEVQPIGVLEQLVAGPSQGVREHDLPPAAARFRRKILLSASGQEPASPVPTNHKGLGVVGEPSQGQEPRIAVPDPTPHVGLRFAAEQPAGVENNMVPPIGMPGLQQAQRGGGPRPVDRLHHPLRDRMAGDMVVLPNRSGRNLGTEARAAFGNGPGGDGGFDDGCDARARRNNPRVDLREGHDQGSRQQAARAAISLKYAGSRHQIGPAVCQPRHPVNGDIGVVLAQKQPLEIEPLQGNPEKLPDLESHPVPVVRSRHPDRVGPDVSGVAVPDDEACPHSRHRTRKPGIAHGLPPAGIAVATADGDQDAGTGILSGPATVRFIPRTIGERNHLSIFECQPLQSA